METGTFRVEALLGALVLALVVLGGWLSFALGRSAPRDAVTYTLMFDSALGLTLDNTVAVAGVKVGIVQEVSVEGRKARVVVAIEPAVVLHDDAKAALRAKTLLGEKYLDLDPGVGTGTLAPGTVIANNEPSVEIDDVLRGVNALVTSLNTVAPPLVAAVERVEALMQGTDSAKLKDELGHTLGELAALIRSVNHTVTTSSGDVQALIRATRERAPATLDQLQHTVARIDTLVAAIDPQALADASAQIKPTAVGLERLMHELKGTLAEVQKAAAQLEPLLGKATAALDRLDGLDERAIREFLQVEGVRVNLIPDARVRTRLKQLTDEMAPAPSH